MKQLLIETMCLPPTFVLEAIVRHSSLLIEGCEHYQKRSFRNRFYINGPQGKVLCSIPLKKGKNAQLPIREVKIADDDPWAAVLLKKIKSCYASAPYYDYIYDDIEDILVKKWKYLWDFNSALWVLVTNQLGLALKTSYTKSYQTKLDNDIIDLRDYYKPKANGDALQSQLRYDQVFTYKHDFIGDLSILDLLMCCGPESLLMLRESGAPLQE